MRRHEANAHVCRPVGEDRNRAIELVLGGMLLGFLIGLIVGVMT